MQHQMHKRKYDVYTGFTLIELLVAITIMASISLMGYTVLDNMLKTEKSLKNIDSILSQIQRVFVQWQADCSNIEKSSIYNLNNNINITYNPNGSGSIDSLWLIR